MVYWEKGRGLHEVFTNAAHETQPSYIMPIKPTSRRYACSPVRIDAAPSRRRVQRACRSRRSRHRGRPCLHGIFDRLSPQDASSESRRSRPWPPCDASVDAASLHGASSGRVLGVDRGRPTVRARPMQRASHGCHASRSSTAHPHAGVGVC